MSHWKIVHPNDLDYAERQRAIRKLRAERLKKWGIGKVGDIRKDEKRVWVFDSKGWVGVICKECERILKTRAEGEKGLCNSCVEEGFYVQETKGWDKAKFRAALRKKYPEKYKTKITNGWDRTKFKEAMKDK